MSEKRSTVAGVTVVQTAPPNNVSAHNPEETQTSWQLVYAPGAGSNIDEPFGTYAAKKLAANGVHVTRFQFPYQEAGKSRPDRPDVLQSTWRAVIDACRIRELKLVVSGRSMGGRVASIVASGGAAVDGLCVFAYPLHQPGHPERARVGHLADIPVPTLFCSGTRDAFGSPEELADAASTVPNATLHILEGADHGFATLKRSGRTREEVWEEALDALMSWVSGWSDA